MKNRLGKLIGGAAKAAKNKLNIGYLTPQDYEEIIASAALGSTKAKKSDKHTDVYEFVAAKNEAMKFILSQIFEKGTTTHFEDYENYEGEPEFVSQFEMSEEQLADLFLKHRKKKGHRGYRASKRDAKICKMILEGYSNEGIAKELRQSSHNIRRYRTDIRSRLGKIVKQKGHPVE